jgi:hypothetical protein
MGRKRRHRNHFSQKKKNSIHDSEGNEDNTYPVSDSNKIKIIDTEVPRDGHKNNLKEEILQEITEHFMEKILDMLKQNVKDALKKFQKDKNKDNEKTQEQINELRDALNEHQSEIEDTINREIKIKDENEKILKRWQDMENLRKKNQTETQNTVEGHSIRLE